MFSELISAQHQGWVLGQLSSLSHTSSSLQGTIILSNLASVLYNPECWETPNNSTLATSWTRMETSWSVRPSCHSLQVLDTALGYEWWV